MDAPFVQDWVGSGLLPGGGDEKTVKEGTNWIINGWENLFGC